MGLYHRIKLWYWWNFTINRDEFHPSLSSMHIYFNSGRLTTKEIPNILIARRQLAHSLDTGQYVPIELIKQARF